MNEQADVIIVIFQAEKIFFMKPLRGRPGHCYCYQVTERYIILAFRRNHHNICWTLFLAL